MSTNAEHANEETSNAAINTNNDASLRRITPPTRPPLPPNASPPPSRQKYCYRDSITIKWDKRKINERSRLFHTKAPVFAVSTSITQKKHPSM